MEDLVKTSGVDETSASAVDRNYDEFLIRNKTYTTGAGSGFLKNPTDDTCAVADTVLLVFNKQFAKCLAKVGIKRHLLFKCKQHLFQKHQNWMKVGSLCEDHRDFFLNRLIIPKLKRSLQQISKELRQPGEKSKTDFWRKVRNLKNE
jgi:hypothetical protein